MGKTFAAGSVVDPVYLNVPEYLLGDAQVNGEYVAYAAKYVSAVSNNVNLGIMTWSQGNFNSPLTYSRSISITDLEERRKAGFPDFPRVA